MLTASLTALAAPNNSLTEHKLGVQPISENSELGNVTLYGYVKNLTWGKGPFNITIPRIMPANALILVFEGTHLVTQTQTDGNGKYVCSVPKLLVYKLEVHIYDGDELVGWIYRTALVLFRDKYVPIMFWDL